MILKKIISKNKFYWSKKSFVLSALSSFATLLAALIINYFAGAYALSRISNGVKDLLLDHLPIVDVGIIVLEASILFISGTLICLFLTPQKLPFTIKSISLFIIIRSLFISLTHLAPYLGIEYQQSFVDQGSLISKFTFGGDLFFSGHTGLPFLLALLFWQNRPLRVLFLIASFVSGGAMLLGHLHYSIDVFGAFFITYAIFDLSKWLFHKDHLLFKNGLATD